MTPASALSSGPALEVISPGALTLVQDLGRPGHAHLGVGPSGAADVPAFARANRIAGNAPSAAGLEILLGGLVVRALRPVLIGLTGAPAPADVDGLSLAHGHLHALAPGQVLRLGAPASGLRTYFAVRGGIGVEPVLGSRSYDTLSRLGPPPLRAGDVLALAGDEAAWGSLGSAGVQDPRPASAAGGVVSLRLTPGPRLDWFDEVAWRALTFAAYRVTADSDRVALRLEGPALARRPERAGDELAPEGLVTGAVQVPPSGLPVVFGPDRPVTGGYPVIAVLTPAAQALAAQLRPGDAVQLTAAEFG